jgi:LDH2 family malate/lactate/ureidoglycolate dehydrogenase
VAIDILSGVLTGAGYSPSVNNMYESWSEPQDVGHLFIALDIERFVPLASFTERLSHYTEILKAEPRATGPSEILHAGEVEHHLEAHRRREGIELPDRVADDVRALGVRDDLAWINVKRANDLWPLRFHPSAITFRPLSNSDGDRSPGCLLS